WTEERLTYRGRYFSFEDIEVLPKPLQRPHPPAWMAAGSLDAAAWAASAGYSILIGPHTTHAETGQQRELYLQQLHKHGYSAEGREIPITRFLAIAPTDAEAAEVARQGAKWVLKTYIDPTRFGAGGDPVQRYVDSAIIHGTAEP